MHFLRIGASIRWQVTPLMQTECVVVLGNEEGFFRGAGELTLRRKWDSGDARVAVPLQFTEGRELGHCRPCFAVQMFSIIAVVLTDYRYRVVRESERREAAGIHILAKGAAYQQGPLLVFGVHAQ